MWIFVKRNFIDTRELFINPVTHTRRLINKRKTKLKTNIASCRSSLNIQTNFATKTTLQLKLSKFITTHKALAIKPITPRQSGN